MDELDKLLASIKEEDEKKIYMNPDKYLPIDAVGDLQLQWFINKYAILRMEKNLPIFEKAFNLLTERGHFSRTNAFGEMHPDGYLWVLKHEKIKVIVEERQSYKRIYIKDGNAFHIRDLQYENAYPQYYKTQLKGNTINKFKKLGFKPDTTHKFRGFMFGDERDEGYIFSKLSNICDYADSKSIYAIRNIEFWEPYLDNPNTLE